jgi:hypothetical protein
MVKGKLLESSIYGLQRSMEAMLQINFLTLQGKPFHEVRSQDRYVNIDQRIHLADSYGRHIDTAIVVFIPRNHESSTLLRACYRNA